MSRTTIDFGIDLGTTNSAIALLKGVSTDIIKNDLQQDITPSAVHFRKNGELLVGFYAKETIKTPRLDDTAIEFKRRMGTDYVYTFYSSAQKRKPEELSAEVLKRLKADAEQKTGEVIEAAVITVPAAFELHQCDATKKAAQLAGFRESPLLLEPTAAALAFGFQPESKKGHWLVFDFGGGTFDATIIKTEEGTIHVVNSGGDNFLGGSDIDKALVSKIIAPRIVEEFGLKEFDWAHAGEPNRENNQKSGRWRQAFARLKWAAEQAKIELSRPGKEKASLDLDTVSGLKDEMTGEVVVEELAMDINRADLVRVAEPFIIRSVEITKRVLKEKNLPVSAIEKVILVGGPTIALYFREILKESLRIPLDWSVDPFTVVARGAAKFAGTQRLSTRTSTPIVVGEYSVELKHKPVGIESAPIVGGKVFGSSAQDFTGFTLELVNTKTQWRSGKIALSADGVFVAHLHAEKDEKNTFAIELYDPSTRKQKVNPDTLTYTIDMVVDEQPLINSMGISRGQNDYLKYFEKGDALPLRKTHDLKTKLPLRQGQRADVIRIPVVEGEYELADRDRLVGVLEIRGDSDRIHRDVPAGSEIQITLIFDASRTITVRAYLPLLDEDFETKIELGRHTPNADFLKEDFDRELKRFREVKSKASDAEADSAEKLVQQVEQSPLLQEVKELLAAAKGDPDAALKCEKRLLELKLKLDEAANSLEWPALVKEARSWLENLNNLVAQCGKEQQSERAAKLSEEIEGIIREQRMDGLRRRLEQVWQLRFEILSAQPEYWVYQFQEMEKQQQKMSDQARAARLFSQGQDCMAKNNFTGLQNVVGQLWELLPRDVEESIKRGYDPGVH